MLRVSNCFLSTDNPFAEEASDACCLLQVDLYLMLSLTDAAQTVSTPASLGLDSEQLHVLLMKGYGAQYVALIWVVNWSLL